MSRAARRRAAKEAAFIHVDLPRRGPAAAGYIALVPGAQVPLLALQLPPGLQGAAREQVAWRQLQDQVCVTADQVEIRPYTGGISPHWTRVLVASVDLMTGWRDRLDPGCRALLPDYLALPAAADLWVLERHGDMLRARLGLEDGFSAEVDLALVMLTQRLADAEQPQPRAVLLLAGELAGELSGLLEPYDIDLVADRSALKPLGIAPPRVLGHGELSADLRIDARAARAGMRRQVLPWLAALLAGGLMVGIWAAAEGLEIRQLQREQAAVQDNIDHMVRSHFVPIGPLLDVRLQVSRALALRQAEVAAGAGRLSPLLLIRQVADVMVAAKVQPEAVKYSQAEGLVLALKVADFVTLDQLVTTLERAGIAAEPRAARVDEAGAGGIRAALHLQVKQPEAEP